MSHAAIRSRRSWPSGDSRYVIRSESIRLIVFSSRTRHGYHRKPSASTITEDVSHPWAQVIRLKSMYCAYSGIGYRACMSRSEVVNRRYHGFWYWYFRSSSMSSRTSGSPPSKLQTITDERARLSRTAFTSSVGMSFQRFLTCQQLQNEQVKLQRRVSLKEQ